MHPPETKRRRLGEEQGQDPSQPSSWKDTCRQERQQMRVKPWNSIGKVMERSCERYKYLSAHARPSLEPLFSPKHLLIGIDFLPMLISGRNSESAMRVGMARRLSGVLRLQDHNEGGNLDSAPNLSLRRSGALLEFSSSFGLDTDHRRQRRRRCRTRAGTGSRGFSGQERPDWKRRRATVRCGASRKSRLQKYRDVRQAGREKRLGFR